MIGKGLHFLGTAHLTDLDARGQLLDPELWPAIDRSDENAQPLRQAMLFDQRVRLPNDLLMRTDRASMYFSLEARVPLLANELIEWANRLPDQFCVRLTGDKTKPLLKHLAATLVPPQVIHRPKRGFDLPLWSWLNTSFRELQHQLLSERAVPFLNYAGFNAMVEDLPRDQSALTSGRLWAWIVLEKWYRLWTQDHGAARPRCPAFAKELPAYPLLAGAAQQPV